MYSELGNFALGLSYNYGKRNENKQMPVAVPFRVLLHSSGQPGVSPCDRLCPNHVPAGDMSPLSKHRETLCVPPVWFCCSLWSLKGIPWVEECRSFHPHQGAGAKCCEVPGAEQSQKPGGICYVAMCWGSALPPNSAPQGLVPDGRQSGCKGLRQNDRWM